MAAEDRERRMLQILVEAVDSLIDDFDLFEFLQRLTVRCVELLDVAATGIMLADENDELQVIAASDEHTRLLELFALQHDQGPCVACYHRGTAQLNIDLTCDVATAGFAAFAARARQAGFTTTHALPMRLREQVIGAINLFHTQPQQLSASDARIAQALADVATIGILQQRTITQGNLDKAQLQAALTSRVLIEQAKGILGERWNTDLDDAFDTLRRYARSHNLRLIDLSRQVIDGTTDTDAIRR